VYKILSPTSYSSLTDCGALICGTGATTETTDAAGVPEVSEIALPPTFRISSV